MRKFLNSVLVSIMFALIACKGSVSVDSPEAETILYDPDSTAVLKVDDVLELTRVIQLETAGPSSMIGEIYQLAYTNGVFVVLDMSNKAVKIFDENGKFVRNISSHGNGPKEYLDIRSICITPNGNIAIVDDMKKRITEFTVDGKYVSDFSIQGYPHGVEYLNNDTLVYESACDISADDDRINASEIYIADRKGEIIGCFGEDMYFKTRRSDYGMSRRLLYRYCGTIFFTLLENNIIYKMNDDGTAVPKYNLQLRPKNLVPMWDKEYHTEDNIMNWLPTFFEQPNFGGAFIEFEDYSIVRYTDHYHYLPMLVYDHRKKQTFAVDETGDDGVFSSFFNFSCAVMDDGHSIACWVSPDVIRSFLQYGRIPDNELFRKAVSEMDDESNPILLVFTFK